MSHAKTIRKRNMFRKQYKEFYKALRAITECFRKECKGIIKRKNGKTAFQKFPF
jgi:hypothetical protein